MLTGTQHLNCDQIIDIIYSKCSNLGCPTPELRICLNDLYSNDFNDVFGSLPAFYNKLKEEKGTDFGQCFITGVPGSFYGRLFPRKSMHFVHSSSSLHWLSQVCICVSIILVIMFVCKDTKQKNGQR